MLPLVVRVTAGSEAERAGFGRRYHFGNRWSDAPSDFAQQLAEFARVIRFAYGYARSQGEREVALEGGRSQRQVELKISDLDNEP